MILYTDQHTKKINPTYFERDLERDLAADLDLERPPPRDFERLRDLERERDRERLRERDRDRLLEDRDLPRPPPPRPERRSSTNRIRLPFNSVSSNFSMAVFMSVCEANSTTLQ